MKKDNVKTVTIRCDDNAEAVVFSKYTMKNSTDFEISFEDSYCGGDFKGVIGRFKRAWMAFWNKPVIYNGIYCGGEGRDRVRNFLKECLELVEGE
jgi:hypothetical protein